MVNITDVIAPEIVSHDEFVKTINANCSVMTDEGRVLTLSEIAILKIARLEAQVDKLNKQMTMLLEALTAGK